MNSVSLGKQRAGRSYRAVLLMFVCAAAALGLLFKDVFRPEEVLFANDGPLGVLKSQALEVPDALTGFWMDLSWVGTNGNTAPISITYALLSLFGPIGYAKFYSP